MIWWYMDVRFSGSPLQLGEDGFSTRDGDFGAGFKLNVFDDKIVKDQSVAAGTDTKTDTRKIHGKTQGGRPLGLSVGEQKDFVPNTLESSPSAQDKGIVGSDDGNGIDTLGFELIVLLEIGRKVVNVAGRSESSGYREDDDFLALPLGGVELDGNTTGKLALKLGGVRDIVEGGLGDGVTDFDCRGHCQVMGRLGT